VRSGSKKKGRRASYHFGLAFENGHCYAWSDVPEVPLATDAGRDGTARFVCQPPGPSFMM
jgi:hypothetical protein